MSLELDLDTDAYEDLDYLAQFLFTFHDKNELSAKQMSLICFAYFFFYSEMANVSLYEMKEDFQTALQVYELNLKKAKERNYSDE